MLIDGRNLPEDHVVKCDICVIGAGPAGLAIANEFLGDRRSVCLIESGGFDYDQATDELSSFERMDTDGAYPDPRYTHTRSFGGSAYLWTVEYGANPLVRYTTLDPIDFADRPWVSPVGWPIDRDSILPVCDRAHRLSDAGPMQYDTRAWITDDRKPFDFEGGRVESKMFSFANRLVFLEQIRDRILVSRNVDLYTWSNVVELEPVDDASHVRAALVACLNGRRYRIQAGMIILATGAFDAPRLLLASDRVNPAGLGNGSDHVGRHLMDHQIVDVGTLYPFKPDLFARAGFYDQRNAGETRIVSSLQLSAAMQTEHRLLNSFFGLCPRTRFSAARFVQRPFGRPTTLYSKGLDRLRAWRSRDPGFHQPLDGRGALTIMSHADDLIRANLWRFKNLRPEYNIDNGAWWEDPGRDSRFVGFDLYQVCEQAPDPDNRVTLSTTRDATGMRRGRIRFRWDQSDRRSVAKSQELLRTELERAGIGRLAIDRRGDDPTLRQMTAHHPAGTTRMSVDPADGVVNRDCRVHGVDNLFIASSSVFPVSGAANPTLMIVALAIRIADHIKSFAQAATSIV